ncbi:cilia- and flagella-associated protein 144 isoform X4 [Callithrix jacchus]
MGWPSETTGQRYPSAVAWRPRGRVAWRPRGRVAWRPRGRVAWRQRKLQDAVHTVTRKPMSWHDNLEEPADARFLNLIHHAAQGPRKKYPETQTENQEVGWYLEPLVNPERHDRRLNHFRVCSDIILYKAKMWGFREDDRHK